jgi:hypothetical protein
VSHNARSFIGLKVSPFAGPAWRRPAFEAPTQERETADVNDEDLLAGQRSYYRARAPEYDEW